MASCLRSASERLAVADAHEPRIAVSRDHAQQVTHVLMVEIEEDFAKTWR